MDVFFSKDAIELTDWFRMYSPQRICIPELSFAVPAFQLQITMVIKTVDHLRWWFFRLAA
ncbi:hypothetical protein ABR28_20635 [Enterobacter hormaechei subsp. hoffmannii]|nr:hypothetical protein ABR28_20635 [Enterobacter hormaechei subsp. hoffmannii]